MGGDVGKLRKLVNFIQCVSTMSVNWYNERMRIQHWTGHLSRKWSRPKPFPVGRFTVNIPSRYTCPIFLHVHPQFDINITFHIINPVYVHHALCRDINVVILNDSAQNILRTNFPCTHQYNSSLYKGVWKVWKLCGHYLHTWSVHFPVK